MRALSKIAPLIANKVFRVNFVRKLTQQQVTVPKQETLTGRILLYLNIDKEDRPNPSQCASEILYKFRQNQNYFHKLSVNEMINFSTLLNDEDISRKLLLTILKEFDDECCSRLTKLQFTEIFTLLNIYMRLIPGYITEMKFYRHAVSHLYDSVNTLNKKDLIQLIFYIGLQKKHLESQTKLRLCLKLMNKDFIDNLSTEELCIICNSTFKTSTKIINKYLLEKLRDFVNTNLSVFKDAALLITFIKSLRHNRCQNDDLLNTILCTIMFNKTLPLYSFSAICHIMALFSDYFFYDEKFFHLLKNTCLEQLNQSSFISKRVHPSEHLRGKDIKRFLWIASMYSEMKLINQTDIKNVIIPKLMERIGAGEFENDHNSLVDISLFLWMLNYQPTELVPYVFTNKIKQLMSNNSNSSNLRLNLLLHAIRIENPDLSKELLIKPVDIPSHIVSRYQLQKRPLIQRLLNNLELIKKELNLSKFQLSQEIPYLNIVGITGYKNVQQRAVYIEVLDDYTKLRNIQEDVPVGLMALKLRLLDRTDEGVLVVSQREVEEMVDAELNEYLLDELKLIC